MTTKRIVAGLGCAWVLWSAQGAGTPPTGATSEWTKVATVGSRAECVAVCDARRRAAAPSSVSAEYACLPEGDDPAER